MRRRPAVIALVLVFSLLAAACARQAGPPTSDVAGTPPWSEGEELSYMLVDARGAEYATGTLSVSAGDQPGTLRLSQSYSNDAGSDDISVLVDARTLKPISSEREILTQTSEDRVEVTYTPEGALIRQGERQTGLSVPDHAYDNDSSLFLWRTLPFALDYEASYVTIITGQRNRQTVNLQVTGKETVRVPAGEFEAWRLDIRTATARQRAWFADTPERPLVRYDNDDGLIFELTSTP